MRVAASLGLLLVTAPMPAVASPGQTQVAPSDTSAEKKVCRRVVLTGSNFGRRVCFTRTEWKQLHERDAANAARALDNRRIGEPGKPDDL